MNIQDEEANLEREITKMFSTIRNQTERVPEGLTDQVQRLFLLRSEIYEDLNQLQHAALILKAAKLLQNEFPEIDRWSWHPKQTSRPDEADLTGYINEVVFLNVEVTTSVKPVGTIDSRMNKTLKSLDHKNGKRYYFVQTTKMLNRAKTKIAKNNWNITPREI